MTGKGTCGHLGMSSTVKGEAHFLLELMGQVDALGDAGPFSDWFKGGELFTKSSEIPPCFLLLEYFISKLNFSLLHTQNFLLHIVSGFYYKDNLINRLSSKLISCGNEARGTGVSTPEDFAIPADSQARLIISQ